MNSKLKKKEENNNYLIASQTIFKKWMINALINCIKVLFIILCCHFDIGILKLRSERDEITSQLLKEKKAYSDYEMMIKKKALELEKFLSKLKEKENKINDYDSIIRQAEQTYQRV